MFAHTFLAAALAVTSTLVAALPAKSQQDIAGAAPAKAATAQLYTTISEDGSCGGKTGFTCEGSLFGNCCSIYGYCGSSETFCGITNCFAGAGLCDTATKTISKAGKDKTKDSKAKVEAADSAKKDEEVLLVAPPSPPPSEVKTTPAPVRFPWRPTPFHERPLKASYVIDNGERAPNQVWD